MKTLIAFITAAVSVTSVHAWGDREQGALIGMFGTLIFQHIQREQQRVVVQETRPVVVYSQPTVIVQESVNIQCPAGTAEVYHRQYDRNGRHFLVFNGCR